MIFPAILFSCLHHHQPGSTFYTVRPRIEFLSAEGKWERNGKDTALAMIKFQTSHHNFGIIAAGKPLESDFDFINPGEADLVIKGVIGSCGCEVIQFPHEPIRKGKSGVIKVKIETEALHGYLEHTVTVLTNSRPDYHELQIRGFVHGID